MLSILPCLSTNMSVWDTQVETLAILPKNCGSDDTGLLSFLNYRWSNVVCNGSTLRCDSYPLELEEQKKIIQIRSSKNTMKKISVQL